MISLRVPTFSSESPPLTFAGLEHILGDAGARGAADLFTDVGLGAEILSRKDE